MQSIPDDVAPVLRTERLALTPLTQTDAPEMFELLQDRLLGAFTGDEPPVNVEALTVTYGVLEARQAPGGAALWLNWIVRPTDDSRPVGYVQATVTDHSARVAWVIGTPFQRRGFASEAAAAMVAFLRDEIGVRDVAAAIHDEHEASKGVARCLGFVPSEDFEDGERIWRAPAR